MDKPIMRKGGGTGDKLPGIGLWLALVLALLGTIGNTAWAFATVDNNAQLMSYIKAVALDVGMVALAATLAQRKRAAQPTLWLWVAVIGFVAGSMYANYLHGQAHLVQINAHLAEWRPLILSALLPLMLFVLVESVSHAPHPVAPGIVTVAPSEPQQVPETAEPPQGEPILVVATTPPPLEVAPVPLTCEHCERPFDTINALNAHRWRCKAKRATEPVAAPSLNGVAHHT